MHTVYHIFLKLHTHICCLLLVLHCFKCQSKGHGNIYKKQEIYVWIRSIVHENMSRDCVEYRNNLTFLLKSQCHYKLNTQLRPTNKLDRQHRCKLKIQVLSMFCLISPKQRFTQCLKSCNLRISRLLDSVSVIRSLLVISLIVYLEVLLYIYLLYKLSMY